MVYLSFDMPENCAECPVSYFDGPTTKFCGLTHARLLTGWTFDRKHGELPCPLHDAEETPAVDRDAVHCNRLKVDDAGRVCCVKDTCDGCPHVPGQCVIEDMLESLGIIDSWKRWEMPNYRERKKEG